MPQGFIKAARERGLSMSEAQLEGLHRLGLLTPLLRVRRDGRAIATLARRDARMAGHVAREEPSSAEDLVEAHSVGRLFTPAREAFLGRRRLERTVDGRKYRSSEYLYSQHQLVHLPGLRGVLERLRWNDSAVTGIDAPKWWREDARERAARLDEIVIAVSALEAVHYPDVMGRLQWRRGVEAIAEYERWREKLPVTWALRWLGVDAAWIRSAAAELLRLADGIDPLGAWLDVVRQADPGTWERLKGSARSAMDVRIAAEVLLRYYDALARARRAPSLEWPRQRRRVGRSIFASRLQAQGSVDDVLTSFGLSPHPNLVLVVEGDTELEIVPRVMRHFGIRTDPDYIRIVNREGVGKDITALVAFAAGPVAGADNEGKDLRLLRPATRMLVVSDAEGKMATATDREKARMNWVERLMRTLPAEQRLESVRKSLDLLVDVMTWNPRGESFEFAHFTDMQIASAIASLDTRSRQPAPRARVKHVGALRAQGGNLKSALPGVCSKLELAEGLWPVLEAKMRRAAMRGTLERIPLVRVLDRATDLAREFPRAGLVIPLEEPSGGAA